MNNPLTDKQNKVPFLIDSKQRFDLELVELPLFDFSVIGVDLFRTPVFEDFRGELRVLYEGPLKSSDDSITYKESSSYAFVGRGLHIQSFERPLRKLIRVQSGAIVTVLLPNFPVGKTVYAFLYRSSDGVTFGLPPNCAHGFIALTHCSFQYITIGKYCPEKEHTINILGSVASKLGIRFPISLSEKDRCSTENSVEFSGTRDGNKLKFLKEYEKLLNNPNNR